ncbi:Gfo/Idh/MocA family protein [Allosphingosinicella deserti]|uniref:Glucose-fructose oxidoreductase n=1 Tax=Allosphingosinicella deserti TaxID=2116704 RepID=A0A2P7QEX4_9SPHN|nr:Gfo/Idh/MocA family oxidoreductase [Sphingomonas deserti]PSJ36528.1 glucose-fructose oxidoreductase [Sphingomonas deserti]
MAELDRRDLLTGLGGLGLAVAAGACSAAEPARPGRKIGYAIVGLGYYATRIIMPQFANCRSSRLTALVSGDMAKARTFAAQYDVPERSLYTYDTFDRIRDNPDVDVVYVILPNSMHAEYTIRSAQAGKHVVTEKPMSVSVSEAEAMVAACRKAGRKLAVGYRSHFQPHNILAMKLSRDGSIGTRRYVHAEHGFVQGDPTKWRLKKALAGGGSLMDMGVYSVQAMRYLTGEEPAAITARSSTDRKDPRFAEVEDMISWTFEFPSGVIGHGMSSYSSNHNHVRLTGDKGRIDLEPATPYEGQALRIARGGKEERLDPPPGPAVNQFVGQLDHMAECILNDRPPLISGEMGLQDMRIVDAIYRSAAGGGTIRL